MAKILVVGGAGYIGSHMVKVLRRSSFSVVVLDNLSTGYRSAVADAELVVGDASDFEMLSNLFDKHRFDAVMNFASCIQVGESITNPSKYYKNNLISTFALLEAIRRFNIKCFVFSSTAAIYGKSKCLTIDESHEKLPINPYGRSKWMVEQILEDYDRAYGLKSVCLRYFNAAGADPDGEIGERHLPETHLIPLVLQAASGRKEAITVFGTDYDTPDGTCIRDYIHVNDLCDAHELALKLLLSGGGSACFNLGNGHGFSVKSVIETANEVTGCNIPVIYSSRRPGDPSRLVADSRLAKKILQWNPKRSDLFTIISDAWSWEQKYPWI